MIRLLGRPKTLCDGFTRRDLLHVGGLSLFGLNLGAFQALQAETTAGDTPHFGRAKKCILVYLFGSPPQHETFDPKLEAPAEIQGELKAIPTSIPGYAIGEGFPRTAEIADRLTIVRSMTHDLPFHLVNYALCGIPRPSTRVEADPNDRTEWPFLGSVIDFLETQRNPPGRPAIPRNVALPFPLYQHVNFRLLGGPYAGFLGQAYDPLWTAFDAQGTRKVPVLAEGSEQLDPYAGVRPEDRLELGHRAGTSAPTIERVGVRRSLLEQFDNSRRDLEAQQKVVGYDRQQESAYALLTSAGLARAIDIQEESAVVREAYGMNLFGQSLLAARRIIEAGGQFVSVFWDAYSHFANGWDTHSNHYPRLKQFLMPVFDHSFPAFLVDLEQRGLLDETAVLCLSEHGRTPQLNNRPGNGREHWSRVYSVCMAGGGFGRGNVVGESDRIGGDVRSNPISPKDMLASTFHLLGVDPYTTIPDQLGRPVPISGDGAVRHELFG